MKADHKKIKRRLSIAMGQLAGIQKMIDDDAYCIDVSNQLLAVIAALKKTNDMVVAAHIRACVMESREEGKEEKLAELEKLMARMSEE